MGGRWGPQGSTFEFAQDPGSRARRNLDATTVGGLPRQVQPVATHRNRCSSVGSTWQGIPDPHFWVAQPLRWTATGLGEGRTYPETGAARGRACTEFLAEIGFRSQCRSRKSGEIFGRRFQKVRPRFRELGPRYSRCTPRFERRAPSLRRGALTNDNYFCRSATITFAGHRPTVQPE